MIDLLLLAIARGLARGFSFPGGSVGMLSRSVFGEMKSTRMPPSYPGSSALSPRTMF